MYCRRSHHIPARVVLISVPLPFAPPRDVRQSGSDEYALPELRLASDSELPGMNEGFSDSEAPFLESDEESSDSEDELPHTVLNLGGQIGLSQVRNII